MEYESKRINNVLYGPAMDVPIDKRGLGRTIFNKMQQYRNRILQIDVNTNEEQTFDYVNKSCIRIALEMQNRGLRANDIILMCSGNTMDALILVYSALYINVVVVTLDPSAFLIDSVHILNTINPKYVFVVESAVDLIRDALAHVDICPNIVVIGSHDEYATLSEFLRPHPYEGCFEPVDVEDIHKTGLIFFSSGTTNLPKGICISHYALLKSCTGLSMSMIDYTTALFYTPFYWISSFRFSTVCVLLGGKRIVAQKFKPETFSKYVQDHKVTFTFLSSSYVLEFNQENTRGYITDSLREMRLGGSYVAPEHIANLRECFPKAKVYMGYGSTESGTHIATFSKYSDSLCNFKLGSCGVPFINTKIKIIDVENGQILGPYQQGEVYVHNESSFKSYYLFGTENSYDNEGYMKTGDIAYYDEDNCLYFCDRLNDTFLYNRWYLIPTDIESVIYQHPAVLETIVIGLPHEFDYNRPLGLVVLKPGHYATAEELLTFVNERVDDREKLRAGLRIVKKFPKTCTGKIPKKIVTQMILTGLVVLNPGHYATAEGLLTFVNEIVDDREKLRAGLRIVKQFPKTCTGKNPTKIVTQMILTSLVVLNPGHYATVEELLTFVNERVDDREKLRTGLRIVKKFPKTCTGKIPKKIVTQMILTSNLHLYND